MTGRIGSRVASVVAVAVLLLSAARLPAQDQSPQATFRAATDLVQIDVSVLDDDRRPVRGLIAADFTILENGRPRPVAAFLAVDRPAPVAPSAAWMRETAPDVTTNAPVEGQVVVIVIDDASLYQTSRGGSLRNDRWTLRKAQEIGVTVLDEIAPGDVAAVVYTGNTALSQNFTTDHARLRSALQVASIALDVVDPAVDPEANERGGCLCGLCSIDTLARLADELQAVPNRRKLVVYISAGVTVSQASFYAPGRRGGEPAFANANDECNMRKRDALTEAVRSASLANVAVYPFDPNGLLPLARFDGLAVERRRNEANFLRTVAEQTGGRAVLERNDQERVVPEVFLEGSSYYLLGFEPEDAQADGALRRVQVRVNRRGVDVRARTSFYLPGAAPGAAGAGGPGTPDATASALDRAVGGLLPSSDLPLQVSVAPFAGADGHATLVVTAGVSDRIAAEGDGAPPASAAPASPLSVRVLTAAFNHLGRGMGAHEQVLTLVPDAAAAGALDYEVLSRLDVEPGRYEVRLAVEADDGRTGSVYAHVDVPDFAREPLVLSGILVDAVPSPTSPASDLLSDVIDFAPTSRRVFTAGDRVQAFVRAYLAPAAATTPVTVRTSVVDALDRVVAEETTVLDVFRETAPGAPPGADYRVTLPVSELPVGEYLLRIEATAGAASAGRTVRFAIR